MLQGIARELRGDRTPRSPWIRYGYGVAAAGAAILLRLAIAPPDGHLVFLTLYPTVFLTALVWGAGPGLLTTLLGGAAAVYLFMPYRSVTSAGADSASIAVFVAFGFAYCSVIQHIRRTIADVVKDLAVSEARLKESQEIARVGSWELQHATNALLWSDETFRIYGLRIDRRELTVERFFAALHPDDREPDRRRFLESVAAGTALDAMHRVVLPDGTVRRVHIRGRCIYSATGEPLRSVGTAQDVTEREALTDELAEARSDLQAILDNIPARITFWNADLTNRFANRSAEIQFGIGPGESTGRHAGAVLGESRFRATLPFMEKALAGRRQSHEYVETVADGSRRFSHVDMVPAMRDGAVSGIYVLATDITELRLLQERLQERLRVSETDFRELAASAGVGIFVTDADGRCTYANPRLDRMLGVPDGAALGEGWKTAVDAQQQGMLSQFWRETVRGRMATTEFMWSYERRGPVRWYRVRGVALPGARPDRNRFLATVEDVTELRVSYNRIRDLAQRLETVREEERRSIALTLHEGIAQDLFAAQLSLQHLLGQSQGRSGVRQAYDELHAALTNCMAATRQVANDLRPAGLAHLRLSTALADHSRLFEKQSSLKIRVNEAESFPDLDEATRLLFFRAAQEALTNVARHAQAHRVDILLSVRDETITMDVIDDGIGIDDSALSKSGSLGLLGIRERFGAAGGGLLVRRNEPHGTTITAFTPRP